MNYQTKIKSFLLFLCLSVHVTLFSMQNDNNNKSFSFASLWKNPFAWAAGGSIISLGALNYSKDSKVFANVALLGTAVSIFCAWSKYNHLDRKLKAAQEFKGSKWKNYNQIMTVLEDNPELNFQINELISKPKVHKNTPPLDDALLPPVKD